MIGRIYKGTGGLYTVKTEKGYLELKARKNILKKGAELRAGDYVELSDSVIEELIPRKNTLIRPPVSNIDKLLIVIALRNPDPCFYNIDKMIAVAEYHGIEPVLILNKNDYEDTSGVSQVYGELPYRSYFISASEKIGTDAVINEINGCTCVLAGVSVGSGSLIDLSPWGLHDEPTVPEVVRSGVDVVTFSGDKVLGGPQAGIIVGKKEYISRMKRNQLLRALRCDKLTLAALEATLRLYRDPQTALRSIPTLRRLTMKAEELRGRAEVLLDTLRKLLPEGEHVLAQFSLKEDFSRVGGGSFPEQGMPTTLVCIRPLTCSASDLRKRLLDADIPVVGRLEDEYFMLDPRTMEDEEFEISAVMIASALSQPQP